jgi:dTMP kinase
MTPETELLLMNASRAQLVREVIQPALSAGEIILSDRFYHSTIAYQGYGRGLDLKKVREIIDFAVGETRPDLTLLLMVPVEVSEARRLSRQPLLLKVPSGKTTTTALGFDQPLRDRMEEADRSFFERVEKGYEAIAAAEPERVRTINATQSKEAVSNAIGKVVDELLKRDKLHKAHESK